MHVVIVEFKVKPEFIDQFRDRVQRQATDSLAAEPNCHVFDVCVDPAAPNGVFLYEVYDDADDFARHLETDHFKAFDAEVAGWVNGKLVRQLTRLS